MKIDKRDMVIPSYLGVIPAALSVAACPPLIILYAAWLGVLISNPQSNYVEFDPNLFHGMKQEAMQRQYDDYIHHLRQMAAYGTPTNKGQAVAALKELGVTF